MILMILTFKTDECFYTRANSLLVHSSSTTLKGHFFYIKVGFLCRVPFTFDGRPNTEPLFYLRDSGNQPLERQIL